MAEMLKQNGYNTMALGKWHLAPYTAYTSAGPFDRWPLGMGFEKFYGFLGGETDQWHRYWPKTIVYRYTDPAGLPSHRGSRRSHDRLYPRPQQTNTGPAVLRLPASALPCPAALPEGIHRQVQGKVRPRLGQGSRGNIRAAEDNWASSRKTPSCRPRSR